MNESSKSDSVYNIDYNDISLNNSELDPCFLQQLPLDHGIDNKNSSSTDNEKTKKQLFVSFIPRDTQNDKLKRKKRKRSYQCTYEGCSKTYKSRENLTLHIKNKHKGVKPYKCSSCSLTYSHRNGKRYHERITHRKSQSLPYKCDQCAQGFESSSAMKAHQESNHILKDNTNKLES